MKNENLFPLERNNYFFGKLMTEREFEKEQMYFNNKRRIFNATLVGSGVVCGLTVTKADGYTIAVESGLAFDGTGRELALPRITLMRLSEMDGFSDDSGLAPYVYLCAEYAETQTEAVHSLGEESARDRFGYTRETMRLFLRYGEPEPFEVIRLKAGEYRGESLEKALERGARERLYLARIYLVRWEEAYEIDRIQQVPFGQYACIRAMPEVEEAGSSEETVCTGRTVRNVDAQQPAISFGMAHIYIPDGANPGSLHYSDDIAHNLGLVPVAVTLGISTDTGVIFGDSSIFNERVQFEYAARVREEEGTFQIGVRVKVRTRGHMLKFIWSAAADPARAGVQDITDTRIIINPPVTRLNTLQTVRLQAEVYGLEGTDVVWSVREAGGGDITRAGVYTAPADPGVYTVVARIDDVLGTAMMVVQ